MLSEREYMQEPRGEWKRSATVVLVALNIVAFLFQYKVLPRLIDPGYFELSAWGLRQGYVWQLLTYQFMHAGFAHVFMNCWALFVFGRGVEWAVGKTRFLILYFLSGIIGGLVQVAASLLWPQTFDGATVGASAGVFGVVASFTMLFPEQQLVMLLFYVIPINMRAKWLLWFFLLLTVLGISAPHSAVVEFLGKNVAHWAHLGGILTGLAFSRFYFLRILRPRPAA